MKPIIRRLAPGLLSSLYGKHSGATYPRDIGRYGTNSVKSRRSRSRRAPTNQSIELSSQPQYPLTMAIGITRTFWRGEEESLKNDADSDRMEFGNSKDNIVTMVTVKSKKHDENSGTTA
jgi:hypothetical protein